MLNVPFCQKSRNFGKSSPKFLWSKFHSTKSQNPYRGEILLLHNGFYCSALLYNAPFTSTPFCPQRINGAEVYLQNDFASHSVTSSPPLEVGASQPRQVWFSFDNTTVLSISELSPCDPRLCYIVSRSCIYQPHSLISDIFRRIYISVMMGSTLRTIPLS